MSNSLFDPERPPADGHRQRLYLLDMLVDHIIEGWAFIDANETESRVFMLRLDEVTRPQGNREAYILYVTQGEWAPCPDAPLIRRLRWRRGADQMLCQHRSVLWPDLDDELFRLDRRDIAELEMQAYTLGHNLAALKDGGQWASRLRQLYELPMPESVPFDPERVVELPLVWRTVDYRDAKITFLGGHTQAQVDAAFVRLWHFFERVCKDANRVHYPVGYHSLEPAHFGVGLRHAAGLTLDG